MIGRALLFAVLLCAGGPQARAELPASVLESVVSLLPTWPAGSLPPGADPEGSGVVIFPGGWVVTALHVVAPATAVTVRLADGRRLPATVVGRDAPTDIALLRIAADPPPLPRGPRPGLAAPVCAIGNAFGLDLSVTCGVVSALDRSGTGFNRVEDFLQTDASVNPGMSGGALVDAQGRLVGMLSAIFTKQSDADIGVNFAVSLPLLLRVAEDLREVGRVRRGEAGLRVERAEDGGVRVGWVAGDGPAAAAGLRRGDRLLAIAGRPLRSPDDVTAALYLQRPNVPFALRFVRGETIEEGVMTLVEKRP